MDPPWPFFFFLIAAGPTGLHRENRVNPSRLKRKNLVGRNQDSTVHLFFLLKEEEEEEGQTQRKTQIGSVTDWRVNEACADGTVGRGYYRPGR